MQRDRQILSQFRATIGRESCRINDRLRQPGNHVLLTPARADVGMSRQIRVVVVMRNALWSDTVSRSAACQRKYVSCTASSASAIDPGMRYARPRSRRRCGSKLSAGFNIALGQVVVFSRKLSEKGELLDRAFVRPRQVRGVPGQSTRCAFRQLLTLVLANLY